MSRYVRSGNSTGYFKLFTSNVGAQNAPNDGQPWGNVDKKKATFARRFGLARMHERNANLIKVLEKPVDSLKEVNAELLARSTDKNERYQSYLQDLRNLGFGEDEAVSRADILIGREIENDLALIQLKYPYAVGGSEAGGWDPVSSALYNNPSTSQLPRTFATINGSRGLGVRGGGVRKGKRYYKRKFQAKYGKA